MILLCRLHLLIVQFLNGVMAMTRRRMRESTTHMSTTSYHDEVNVQALMAKRETSTPRKTDRVSETTQIAMDSDSYEMRIDTGASHCISYNRQDFVGRMTLTRGSIQGYHETETQSRLYLGTMKFKITDDDDKEHTFEVPNSIYDE